MVSEWTFCLLNIQFSSCSKITWCSMSSFKNVFCKRNEIWALYTQSNLCNKFTQHCYELCFLFSKIQNNNKKTLNVSQSVVWAFTGKLQEFHGVLDKIVETPGFITYITVITVNIYLYIYLCIYRFILAIIVMVNRIKLYMPEWPHCYLN